MNTTHPLPIETHLQQLFEAGDPQVASKSREQAHVDTLSRLFGCLVSGDYSGFAQQFAPDAEVELLTPDGFPFVRRAQGPQAIADLAAHNFACLSDQVPELKSLTCQGDQATLVGREKGRVRDTGREYDIQFVYAFTFQDGKVTQALQVAADCSRSAD